MYNKEKAKKSKFLVENIQNCKFCGKECHNLNSLKQHECRCKLNPNRKAFTNLSNANCGWSKGLTKETDVRVKNNSISSKNYYKTHEGAFKGKHHTEEFKKWLSDYQTNLNHSGHNRNSHGKRGKLDNIYFMSTYELAYYIYRRDNNMIIKPCKSRYKYIYKNKTHYYTPDFIIENNQIVEIKGRETELDKIKYKAVPNLKILYQKEIIPLIKWVKDKYNVDYIEDLYEIKLSKNCFR